MDPFSIVVGAVALTEVANKLAGTLTDRYKAFTSAPKQIIEIAGQITLCAGLVDVFAKSVDRSGQQFPARFQKDAASLVKQCQVILKDIDEMIPHGSAKPDYSQRLRYAFRDEKKIAKHQDRLKQVQHMFMFMTTCWMYELPAVKPFKPSATPSATPAATPAATLVATPALNPVANPTSQLPREPFILSTPSISTGTFIPVQFTMESQGPGQETISYEATLTLKLVDKPGPPRLGVGGHGPPAADHHFNPGGSKPFPPPGWRGPPPGGHRAGPPLGDHFDPRNPRGRPISVSRPRGISPQKAKPSGKQTETLENMRRSPYFSLKLLESPAGQVGSGYIEEVVRLETANSKNKKDRNEKGRDKSEQHRELEALSREEAEKGVGDMLAMWFPEGTSDESDDTDDETYHTISPNLGTRHGGPPIIVKRPSSVASTTSISKLSPRSVSHQLDSPAPEETIFPKYSAVDPPRSLTSPVLSAPPVVESVDEWDWRCDGCKRTGFFHDLRYKCQECSNFDFCPECFEQASHVHPTSTFVRRDI